MHNPGTGRGLAPVATARPDSPEVRLLKAGSALLKAKVKVKAKGNPAVPERPPVAAAPERGGAVQDLGRYVLGATFPQDAPTTAETFSTVSGALLVAVGTSGRVFTDRTRTVAALARRSLRDAMQVDDQQR